MQLTDARHEGHEVHEAKSRGMPSLDFLRGFQRNCELAFEGAKRMECTGPSRRFGWGATARPRAIPLRREGKAVTTLRAVTALQTLARVPERLGSRKPEPFLFYRAVSGSRFGGVRSARCGA
jgi:hypothetical protein